MELAGPFSQGYRPMCWLGPR